MRILFVWNKVKNKINDVFIKYNYLMNILMWKDLIFIIKKEKIMFWCKLVIWLLVIIVFCYNRCYKKCFWSRDKGRNKKIR